MPKSKSAMSRIVRIVAMLKENRYPNHPRVVEAMRKMDIVGEYAITQKTIQRDIDFLKDEYHAPIAYNFANRGYYLTDPTWVFETPIKQEAELEAMALCSRIAERIMPNPIGGNLRHSIDILLANRVSKVSDDYSMLLSLVATGAKHPLDPDLFQTVFHAWRTHHVLQLTYERSCDGVRIELLVEPHVMAFHEGNWYLHVRLLQYDDKRYQKACVITLAIHRIKSVSQVATVFKTNHSIVKKANAGRLFDFPRIKNIELKLHQQAIVYGVEIFSVSRTIEHTDGSLSIHIPEAEEYRLVNFVMAWPGDVQVIAPLSLREKVLSVTKCIFETNQI